MDEVEIEVLKSPVGQLLLSDWDNVLLVVEGVPELGGDENILTLDDSLSNSFLQSLTSLLLVSVI